MSLFFQTMNLRNVKNNFHWMRTYLCIVSPKYWIHYVWTFSTTVSKKSWHFGCFIMKTIWFYTLFLLINKALALCENARHRNSVTFIGKTDFVATSSAFDSLGLLNFRWIFGALVIELDTIVFMTSSYQVFLEIRFGSTLAIF